jgi:hypothetical protein
VRSVLTRQVHVEHQAVGARHATVRTQCLDAGEAAAVESR